MTYGSVTNCKVRNGTTRSEYECRIGYEVVSQSTANNTSDIKLRLECRSINSSYQTKGSSGLTTYVDGTKVKDNAAVDMSNTNVWQNFGERTITVSHNSDGTYSSSKSGSFTCSAGSSQYSLASGSASVTVNPPQIPRYANFTAHSVSSVGLTSLTITWDADANCDAVQYKVDSGDWVNTSGKTYTISGLTPNTQYSVKTRIRRADSQLWTESDAVTGTTYNKATISAPNFNLGDSFDVTITNPSGQSVVFFMETLNESTREDTIRSESTSAGTHTITLTDTELDMIYRKIDTDNTATIRIGVSTIDTYYDYQDKICTLTGNQKTAHTQVSGSIKRAKVYVGVDGTVKRAVVWVGNNGRKRCI